MKAKKTLVNKIIDEELEALVRRIVSEGLSHNPRFDLLRHAIEVKSSEGIEEVLEARLKEVE